ncbi:MAG: SDR family NAD(P)-dependent oxidoreductase, partial [Myxococcota bacterium]
GVGVRELQGRAAVVTGGASGIGRALVRSLADAGASVAIADVDLASAEALRDEIVASARRAIAVRCDVSRYADVQALAEQVHERLGDVAVLCNNAGIGGGLGPEAIDLSVPDWEAILGVNLFGVIHGVRAFAPRMVAACAGAHIVNTASMAAFLPAPRTGPYTTSKFAVVGLSEVMRAELAPRGVGVSVLCPGPYRTAIWGDAEAGAQGDDPAVLGPRVLAAIASDEPFIFTHPEFASALSRRFARIADDLRQAGPAMQAARHRVV